MEIRAQAGRPFAQTSDLAIKITKLIETQKSKTIFTVYLE